MRPSVPSQRYQCKQKQTPPLPSPSLSSNMGRERKGLQTREKDFPVQRSSRKAQPDGQREDLGQPNLTLQYDSSKANLVRVMRTSRSLSLPSHSTLNMKRTHHCVGQHTAASHKKRKRSLPEVGGKCDFFDSLPDDLVLSILSKLSSTASSPSDFISALITCKRLNDLGHHSLVLSKACQKALAIGAKNWSDSAHRFLKQCVDAGNVEACYILGMIRFYCLQNRGSGASLMAKAAIRSHAPALYSLAVIQFNGSGGSKNDKDLRAGVALCARAAFLGHIDALRELGHCLQDGYGVCQNITEGRRFLVQANARELAAVLSSTSGAPTRSWSTCNPHPHHRLVTGSECPLLSDFGCNVPAPEAHPASRFMAEWFAIRGGSPGPGLRLCSHVGCGRPETRRHEFRRCSVCGIVNYCSRACQALDWKLQHKAECTPVEIWPDNDGEGGDGDGGVVNADAAVIGGS